MCKQSSTMFCVVLLRLFFHTSNIVFKGSSHSDPKSAFVHAQNFHRAEQRLGDEAVFHVFAVDLSNVCSSVLACRETSDMSMVMWFLQSQRLSTDIRTSAVDLAAEAQLSVVSVSPHVPRPQRKKIAIHPNRGIVETRIDVTCSHHNMPNASNNVMTLTRSGSPTFPC